MPSHTIVAIFDTHAHADLAIADLSAAGISSDCIKAYTEVTQSGITTTETAPADARSGFGLWAWLTGEERESEDHTLYDRSIESGHTVVTVIAGDNDATRILSILEEHAPLSSERHQERTNAGSQIPSSSIRRYTAAHAIEEQIRRRDRDIDVTR